MDEGKVMFFFCMSKCRFHINNVSRYSEGGALQPWGEVCYLRTLMVVISERGKIIFGFINSVSSRPSAALHCRCCVC